MQFSWRIQCSWRQRTQWVRCLHKQRMRQWFLAGPRDCQSRGPASNHYPSSTAHAWRYCSIRALWPTMFRSRGILKESSSRSCNNLHSTGRNGSDMDTDTRNAMNSFSTASTATRFCEHRHLNYRPETFEDEHLIKPTLTSFRKALNFYNYRLRLFGSHINA